MIRKGLYIDSSLLVLLIVGRVRQDLISKHRRLREFSVEDYQCLIDTIDQVAQVFVTPNTLTETSNLLAHHKEPERSRFFDMLENLIEKTKEVMVASIKASKIQEFRRLGLTDAVFLMVATAETPLITTDFKLYHSVSTKNPNAVINFRHLLQ